MVDTLDSKSSDESHAGSSPVAGTIGIIAQLGERLAGSQEVRGSSPLGSTILKA